MFLELKIHDIYIFHYINKMTVKIMVKSTLQYHLMDKVVKYPFYKFFLQIHNYFYHILLKE